MRSTSVTVAVLALSAVLTCGCADKSGRPSVLVNGTLAFSDGRPLPTGTHLMFNPADGATETGVAVTDEGGRFQVDRVSGRKGLLTGKYTILLGAPEGADRASFFKTIPNEYYDGGVLNADVQEGMSPLALRIQPRKRN